MTNELINPTETLSLFEGTKKERLEFAVKLVHQISEGHGDPLKVHLQVKCMEDLLDTIKENPIYKNLILEAAQLYGAKTFEFHNAKFTMTEVGVKYDYSQSADPTIISLYQEQESLKKRIKDREKMLQALPASGMADPETGLLVYPPSRKSTSSVSVTLK